MIKKEAYARAGLIGNPSDGFKGKTISLIVKNYKASVKLKEQEQLEIVPNSRDRLSFEGVTDFLQDVDQNGYYGGIRILKATIKTFCEYCKANRIKLESKNFGISYHSDIPRHVGLAGSSAIITATMRALSEFYNVELPKVNKPNLVLNAEKKELRISAGLQDRVVQVYEGVVYMDFSSVEDDSKQAGEYEPLDPMLLPKLFIAFRTDIGEGSDIVHNDVFQRYHRGDNQVKAVMEACASYAKQAKQLLVEREPEMLGPLMSKNFDQRATIYNISEKNKRMVEIARSCDGHAKFSGSGGAVVGTIDEDNFEEMKTKYNSEGYEVIIPQIQ